MQKRNIQKLKRRLSWNAEKEWNVVPKSIANYRMYKAIHLQFKNSINIFNKKKLNKLYTCKFFAFYIIQFGIYIYIYIYFFFLFLNYIF